MIGKRVTVLFVGLLWTTGLFLQAASETLNNVDAASVKDTIEYRAQVWVDKTDLERYGGEEDFRRNLKKMFHYTTLFWNESPNKFEHYFRFVPAEELHIYDIRGDRKRYEDFRRQAFGKMDTSKADFVLFLALNAESEGLSCGGGGESGQAGVRAVLYRTCAIAGRMPGGSAGQQESPRRGGAQAVCTAAGDG